MSFLDRFQNKIATVTAHGHLKKADGSEEIRVGPPKRKPQPAAASGSSAGPPQAKGGGNNQNVTHVHVQPSARGQGGGQAPHLQSVNNTSSKQAHAQPQHDPKPAVNSARQSYPSPSASPRSKTHRDAYDYGNNNNYHQPQKGGYYHEPNHHVPGRASHDDYGHYEKPSKGGYSPSKGGSPERQYTKNDEKMRQSQPQYQQPPPQQYAPDRAKNRSPVPVAHGQPNECPSPRDRNEARVQTDEDQLAFSRKARPVQFAPCTLSQYKKEKPAGYYELGKLQPDLNADELVQKRANMERIKSFSKNLRQINKTTTAGKKGENEAAVVAAAAQKKSNSSREKALAFAKHVPKPRLQQRPLGESSGALSTTSSSDSLPAIQKHVRPINSVMDDDAEDDEVSSELQQLQMRHQASRAQVEALIRST